MTTQEFQKKYNSLSDSEKDFLKLLALCVDKVTTKDFSNILIRNDIKKMNDVLVKPIVVQRAAHSEDLASFIDIISSKTFIVKSKVYRYLLKEALQDERILIFIEMIRAVIPLTHSYWARGKMYELYFREIQFAAIEGEWDRFLDIDSLANRLFSKNYELIPPFETLFLSPFNPLLLQRFPEQNQYSLLDYLLFSSIYELDAIDEIVDYLQQLIATNPKGEESITLLGNAFIFQGKIDGNDTYFTNEARRGWVAFLKGKNKEAITFFESNLKQLRKQTRKRKIFPRHVGANFFLLALLKTQDRSLYKTIQTYIDIAYEQSSSSVHAYIKAIIHFLNNETNPATQLLKIKPQTSIDWLFKGLVTYWMEEIPDEDLLSTLARWQKEAEDNGLKWLAMEYAAVLAKLELNPQQASLYSKKAETLQKEINTQFLIDTIRRVEKWERILSALEGVTLGKQKSATTAGADTRLVWLVDFKKGNIQPKEQKINKKGAWSKGRNIALKRIKAGELSSMSPQDHQVAKTIKMERYGYYGSEQYFFDYDKTIRELAGHPLLFRYDNATVPVELSVVKPELIVEEKSGFYQLGFSHPIMSTQSKVIQETPTRFNYVQFDKEHLQIANALGSQKVAIPKAAKAQLGAILEKMQGRIALQSTLVAGNEDLPTHKGDTTIYVHLLPFGDGFKLEFFVKPAGEPPYFKPGVGRKEFIAGIEEQKTLVQRNLKKEKTQVGQVEKACPTLQKVASYQGEWTFEEVDTCLNILVELDPLKEQDVVKIEWPKGEKVRLSQQVGFDQFAMRIQRENDWFGVSGNLQLDDGQVIEMRYLLDLMQKKDSRFVELKDGQFIALTNSFKKKLSEVNAYLERSGEGMKVHNLAVAAMEGFTSLVKDLEVDKQWKQQINRLKKSRKIKHEVPSTFKAELRAYQLEGYQWLQRLAYWGVGACLADDMGLGKTIQGLAVLIDRAKKGPALVVAPASVCRNWKKECHRFAPTLQPILFGSGDRKATIKGLKGFDVLITTYGLLHQEADLFASKKFGTIILDEAQAIKNQQSKRSKAAMKLKGDFKIITTGTPIENHLGELWNLFNFLNPGLLGSYDSFQSKYALPIEKDKDKVVQLALRKLIQPFILRRKKNEVLDDLPSKTEIVLTVELSREERAFYEALRQSAVEKIAMGQQESGGHQGMQILAEISRLRQACCHPKLVNKTVQIESSKLQLLRSTIEELLSNGHKALIFSQFVKHLKIIEQLLQEMGVSYQYLDGQTSLKQREKNIDAFQSGEGDIFLISLKAGGVGLNLTAADFVIHTDPWWNPAVEDQASDRAHRIGQKRPVTIYRLVTENTIEEKIVALHHHKRDLADSLLEGTERSGRLSADELLALIRNE